MPEIVQTVWGAWNKDSFRYLEREYFKNKDKKQFTVNGQSVDTGYAKHLLVYLNSQFNNLSTTESEKKYYG